MYVQKHMSAYKTHHYLYVCKHISAYKTQWEKNNENNRYIFLENNRLNIVACNRDIIVA